MVSHLFIPDSFQFPVDPFYSAACPAALSWLEKCVENAASPVSGPILPVSRPGSTSLTSHPAQEELRPGRPQRTWGKGDV
jgi:hypothetical protein